MTEAELEQLSKAQLIGLVLALAARIAALEEENRQLRAPPKTPTNSSVPPSKSYKPNRQEESGKKKRGPPEGHPGRSRERREPDFLLECRVDRCRQCGEDLREVEQAPVGASQLTEIPPVEPVVIEARRYGVVCPQCGHEEEAPYPEGWKPERAFGPWIEAMTTYFHEVQHVPYERLQSLFRDVFHLEISLGALVHQVRETAERLQPAAENIHEAVRTSPVIGSDETGARVDGKNWWEWVFQTPEASYHIIEVSRCAKVIEEMLAGAEPEVWNSDCLGAQMKTRAQAHQLCMAHQLRNVQYPIDADACPWAKAMKALFQGAIHLHKQRALLSPADFQEQVQEIEDSCDALLSQEVTSTDSRRLQRRYRKHREALFVFLHRTDVSPDNNASERDLRPSVIHRKVTGGFRSEWAPKAFSTVTTVIQTAKKRGENLFQAIRGSLDSPLPTARSPT